MGEVCSAIQWSPAPNYDPVRHDYFVYRSITGVPSHGYLLQEITDDTFAPVPCLDYKPRYQILAVPNNGLMMQLGGWSDPVHQAIPAPEPDAVLMLVVALVALILLTIWRLR